MHHVEPATTSTAPVIIDLTDVDAPPVAWPVPPPVPPPPDPLAGRRAYVWAKRVIDLTGALVLIVLVLPLAVAAAGAVKLSSPGPVLFAHDRLGLGGRRIRCWKFRTMVDGRSGAPEGSLGETFADRYKLDDDPRVTPVGRVLRRLSLDELPQLLNVIGGSMSLIGPRPIVVPEAVAKWGRLYPRLAQVKPGLSGLWQVSGRSTLDYDERIRLDLTYVERCSLRLDLWLLARTVPALVLMRGAT